MSLLRHATACLLLSFACSAPDDTRLTEPTSTSAASASSVPVQAARTVTVSIVGTNDLHGRVTALPLLGGYVENLRRVRAKDGGVLLVDAGDMFQGTLESNLLEGVPVRDAYAALGYAAATVGNHEFDFGPAGPDATPRNPTDDPRGALKALAKDAPFPFLIANVTDKASGKRVDYPNMPASVLVDVAGVRIGIVGVTTAETLHTTISTNVKDLGMIAPAKAIEAEATALRAKGARAVVVLAHAGGKCVRFTNDLDKDQCETDAEIFKVVRTMPAKTVDAIVAGHTHAGLAHDIDGVPVIEQFSYGRAFGRVDLTFTGDPPVVSSHHVFEPRELCPKQEKPDFTTCDPGDYEGAKVERVAKVTAAISPGVEIAKAKRASKVGVLIDGVIRRDYHAESALGNLFADLILDGLPGADVALMNGGGLREDLPAGDLLYGALFESFPFDNRMASAKIKVGELKKMLASHLGGGRGGILSIAGVRVRAHCKGAELVIELSSTKGKKKLADDDTLSIAASDFMLLGGDGFWGEVTPPEVSVKDDLMRDVFEKLLAKRKTLKPAEVFDPKKPRFDLERPRPIFCK